VATREPWAVGVNLAGSAATVFCSDLLHDVE
jgi:hypothetical protein